MHTNDQHIDELIAKYCCGEASPAEVDLLLQWKNESEDNEREFAAMTRIMQETTAPNAAANFNTDKAWGKVKMVISKNTNEVQPHKLLRFTPHYIRIAAVLLVAVGLGLVAYYLLLDENKHGKQFISQNEIRKESLPDGSKIILHKNTTITFNDKDFTRKRNLQLTGEAFFDIKHDNALPFIIEAGKIFIEDIGTSFNVDAYPGSGQITVTVKTGVVKMYDSDNNSLILTAGEEANYDEDKKTLTKYLGTNKNKNAYADRILIFENTRLDDVVKLLNKIYESKIILAKSEMNDCKLTATFNNEKLNDILSVIVQTMKLKIDYKENAIVLTGENCQ